MNIDPNVLEETEEERKARHQARRSIRARNDLDPMDLTRAGFGDPFLIARMVVLSRRITHLASIISETDKLLNAHIVAAHWGSDDLVTWRRRKREAQAAKEIAGEEIERAREEIRSIQSRLIKEKEEKEVE